MTAMRSASRLWYISVGGETYYSESAVAAMWIVGAVLLALGLAGIVFLVRVGFAKERIYVPDEKRNAEEPEEVYVRSGGVRAFMGLLAAALLAAAIGVFIYAAGAKNLEDRRGADGGGTAAVYPGSIADDRETG